MIINEDKIKKINKLVNETYNSLIIEVSGKNSLENEEKRIFPINPENENLIEIGYLAGSRHANLPYQTKMAATLPKFLKEISAKRGGRLLSAVQKYSVNALKLSISNDLKLARDKTRNILENLIRIASLEYKDKTISEAIVYELEQGIITTVPYRTIVRRLKEATKDFKRNWNRIVVTAISDASNIGRMDAILEKNKGEKPENILVYRLVMNDQFLCQWCRKFYLDDNGSPKVYKLSTLMANGSNYGKKKSEWKPVVGATHPNERCVLLELPKGFDFESGTNSLKFISKDYRSKNVK